MAGVTIKRRTPLNQKNSEVPKTAPKGSALEQTTRLPAETSLSEVGAAGRASYRSDWGSHDVTGHKRRAPKASSKGTFTLQIDPYIDAQLRALSAQTGLSYGELLQRIFEVGHRVYMRQLYFRSQSGGVPLR